MPTAPPMPPVASEPRIAVIAGATGLVGGHCLRALCESPAYLSVFSIGRRAPAFQHPKHTPLLMDFSAVDLTAITPTDVYCTLGTTIRDAGSQAAFRRVDFEYVQALANAAKAAGAARIVLASSIGADHTSRIFYNRVKGEAERAVIAAGLARTVIVRPSVLVGERPIVRAGERFGLGALRVATPLLVGALRKYRPIAAERVADVMVREGLRDALGLSMLESDRIAE